MFDRRVGGRELRFEPSGVLMGGSIVMQDKETDSFWPLFQGGAAHGPLKGTSLQALPVSMKVRFEDWLRVHPDTVVLSVGGREYLERNPLEPYLASSYGFRGTVAEDTRLPTKEPVFGFEWKGQRYTARGKDIEGGSTFPVGGGHVFLYRPQGAALNVDTAAFLSERGFARRGADWVEVTSGSPFDPARRAFAGGASPLRGYDTFWYVWSLNFPGSTLLAPAGAR